MPEITFHFHFLFFFLPNLGVLTHKISYKNTFTLYTTIHTLYKWKYRFYQRIWWHSYKLRVKLILVEIQIKKKKLQKHLNFVSLFAKNRLLTGKGLKSFFFYFKIKIWQESFVNLTKWGNDACSLQWVHIELFKWYFLFKSIQIA